MRFSVTQTQDAGGRPVIEVQVTGPLPVVLLPALPFRLTVRGHGLEEQR